MLDLTKYRKEVEDKISFIEKSNSASVLERDLYTVNVGHVRGLQDALEILQQTLVEQDEQEEDYDPNNENAG